MSPRASGLPSALGSRAPRPRSSMAFSANLARASSMPSRIPHPRGTRVCGSLRSRQGPATVGGCLRLVSTPLFLHLALLARAIELVLLRL
eukprot:6331388-Pyramimonas_sp.AAC.1